MKPFLFLSYGMTKCGSTLAFQLARVALIQAGFPQPVVVRGEGKRKSINFIPPLTRERANHLFGQARSLGYPLAIKTHAQAEPPARRMIARGRARAHAVYRDPRDMALSMLDHGRRARADGKPAFSEIGTLADAERGIDNQLEKLASWLEIPGVRALPYDRVAFDTVAVAAEILEHLEIDGDPQSIADQVLTQEFIQRNKAVRNRHLAEMAAADSARFRARYAPFYDQLLDRTAPALPLPEGTCFTSELTIASGPG